MTEAEVFVVFTTTPSEDQLAKTKAFYESLGMKVSIGAPRPRG